MPRGDFEGLSGGQVSLVSEVSGFCTSSQNTQ
jgi:hypothetical protein